MCIWFLPISDDLFGPDAQNWDSGPCSALRGLLELGSGARCPPALTEGAHSCSLLQAPSLTQPRGFPNTPSLWQLVPNAGEELSRDCDRDRQVVEARAAEWGGGKRGHSVQLVWAPFRALAPSPGSSLALARRRQLGSGLVCASYCRRPEMRGVSSLNCSCLLCEMGIRYERLGVLCSSGWRYRPLEDTAGWFEMSFSSLS